MGVGPRVGSLKQGPFSGVLLIRVPYYIGNLKGNPRLENYLNFFYYLLFGGLGLGNGIQSHAPKPILTLQVFKEDPSQKRTEG